MSEISLDTGLQKLT